MWTLVEELRLERKKKSLYQVSHAWDSRPEKGMPTSEVATKLPCEVSWQRENS